MISDIWLGAWGMTLYVAPTGSEKQEFFWNF